jgi:hypothetical protein
MVCVPSIGIWVETRLSSYVIGSLEKQNFHAGPEHVRHLGKQMAVQKPETASILV